MNRFFLLLLLLCVRLSSLSAGNIPTPRLAGHDTPGQIFDCISVLNGAYFLSEVDLDIAGPTPLRFERFWDSLQGNSTWNFCAHRTATFHEDILGGMVIVKYFSALEQSGSWFAYAYDRGGNTWAYYTVPKNYFHSNDQSGLLSARTNLRNQVASIKLGEPGGRDAKIYQPDGTQRYYTCFAIDPREVKLRPSRGETVKATLMTFRFALKHEILPNKNKFLYSLGKNQELLSLSLANSVGETLSSFSVAHNPTRIITASDGQKASHTCGNNGNLIKEASSTEGITTTYEYDSAGRLCKQSWPDGRFQQVKYRDKSGVVAELLEPVGIDDKPIAVAKLKYEKDYTDVYNAQDILTRYYSADKTRVDSVEFYTKQADKPVLHSVQRLFYNNGFLISRCHEDANHNILTCTVYEYDARGNVLEEKQYGNLSGNCAKPILLGNDKKPQNNGIECLVIRRTYSNDLIATEDDGRKRIEYQYLNDTPLLTAKLTYEGKSLKHREFYTYDKNAALTSITVDDGEKYTERHIRKITPRLQGPAIGSPEIIEEFVLEKGVEKLLKKEVWTYSSFGKVTQRDIYDATNTLRYTLHMEYDDRGNLILETDPLGHEIHHVYDANKNCIFTQGPSDDFHTEFRYDFSNRLTHKEKVEKNGKRWIEQHRYDTLSHKIADIDIYGNETKYVYDAFGNLLETHLPDGAVFKKSYDALNRLLTETDANGHTTTYRYNVRGQPIEVIAPDGSIERSFYTIDGFLEKVIYRDGRETRYQYDYAGRETSVETFSADGQKLSHTTKEYNAFRLLRVTETNGRITQHEYDAAGRLSATIRDDQITRYTYDALGHLWKTSEAGRITINENDLLGRVIEKRIEDASGKLFFREQYKYDARGNCIETISYPDNQPAVSYSRYNCHDELIESTDAEGHTTRYIYERNTCLTKTTIDPLGNKISTIHNSRQQPIQITHTDAPGKKLSERTLHYDANGNCIETRDWTEEGPEICKKRRYGINNRLEELVEAVGTPEAKCTTWQYDSCQRLSSMRKPNGVVLSYTYDHASRIARIVASDGSVDDRYSYDEMHRLAQVRDKNGCLLKRTYDLWDHCIAETLSNGAIIQRSYDPQGRCVKLLLPDNTPIDYAYDAYALKTVTYGNYQHRYLERDLAGRLRKSQLANEATLTFTYDRTGKITSIETDQWKSQAKYDASGRLQERIIHDAEGIFTETFAYDGKHQLTEEPGHQYAYDALGNCKQVDQTACAHNTLNQTLHNDHGDYVYDANGNLISFQRDWPLTCRYDAYDRLIEACCSERFKATYRYDALHRRVEKQMWYWDDNQWQRGPTKKFLYDGQNEIGALDEHDQIVELRVLGTGFGAEIGAAVVIELDGVPYVPVHDEHGNVVTLLDFGNDIVSATRYSAFGESTGNMLSPWGYASKRLDSETQWIYFGRRYYLPNLRRWTTADPKGEADGPNLYTYLLNDPYNRFDLYGEHSGLALDPRGFRLLMPRMEQGGRFVKSAAGGMIHGTANFALRSLHDLHTSAFYIGSGNMDLSLKDRLLMLSTVERSQVRQMASLDRGMMQILGADPSDAVYHTFRAGTSAGLELGSMAVAGYGIARAGVSGLTKAPRVASKLDKIPTFFTKTLGSGHSLKWPSPGNGRSVINGIEYTTHALERMAPRGMIQKGTEIVSRGVPPSVVENAIRFGTKRIGNTTHEIVHTFENVRVVTNLDATKVITVISIGK